MRDTGTEFDDKSGGIGTKGLMVIGAVGMLTILFTALLAIVCVSASPTDNTNTQIATSITPTIQPTITPTIAPTAAPTATPAPKYFDGRKYGAPGNMLPDTKYEGVYIGNLGGTVAFIDIETYLENGGVCRTGNMNGVPMYTRFGLDPQCLYDPATGIVWSLIENPWLMELYNEKRGALGYV